MTTYVETIRYLFGIRLLGTKLGLETIQKLLEEIGNPHFPLRFIHIAGTNGKGSVAAMLSSVLTAGGYKTGLYTSPHLVSFCERIQICGKPISEADVIRLVAWIKPFLEQVASYPEFRHPTYFEVVTSIALQFFYEQKVDIVVWETGLGGRFDATNVVTPLVSVITNIATDHSQFLGTTLQEIASEKCGIIKSSVPVVTATSEPECLAVIQKTCEQSGSPLTVVGKDIQVTRKLMDICSQHIWLNGTQRDFGVIEIPLLGEHQMVNCATAIATLEASNLDCKLNAVHEGLSRTQWPGRFQIIRSDPITILDGAHNVAATEQLARTLSEYFPDRKFTLIFGALRDKNYTQMCRILAPLAARILFVQLSNERSCSPSDLAKIFESVSLNIEMTVSENVAAAYKIVQTDKSAIIVITGSLFLVGEALRNFGSALLASSKEKKRLIFQ